MFSETGRLLEHADRLLAFRRYTPMKRTWVLLSLTLLTLLGVTGGVRADDDDIEVSGRKLPEWIEILRGEYAEKERQTAVLAVGVAASERGIWQSNRNRQQRAGLIALELIGPGKSRQVFPAILAVLRDDPEEKIRESSASSLGRLAARLVADANAAYKHDSTIDRKTAVPLSPVRDGLATALRADKSPRVREACAASLGRLEWAAKDAVPALAQALKDTSPGVRGAAVVALGRVGKEAGDAAPALLDVLKDDKADKLMRSQAAQAIGLMGPDAPVDLEVLLNVWHDAAAPAEVRADVATALGLLEKTSAAIDLGNELKNRKNDVAVRRAAAVTLDGFGAAAKPAVSPLRDALKDDDKFVRALAMHTLGKIGKDLGTERKGVVEDLLTSMSDRVLEVRVAAIETLGALGPDGLGDNLPGVVERLNDAKRDSQKAVRDAATDALKKLVK
jgi:HEAT repeat protein